MFAQFASDGSHYEKRGKGEPVCIDDEIPFEIPESWAWVRLEGLLKDIIVPIRDKPAKLDGSIPWCRIEDVEGRYLSRSLSKQGVDVPTIVSMNLKVYPVGTVLCSNSGTIGVPAIVTTPCVTNQRFIGFLPATGLSSTYLYLLFLAFNKTLTTVGTGTTHAYISRGKFEGLLVPLPPVCEQERIVNTYDVIEPLVDQYRTLESARERLDAELPDKLRKSILQLAVQGKLVEQDPADEPVSVLLERIRAERAQLVKAKKLKAPKGGDSVIYRASDGGYYEKRGKGEPVCIDDEIPFEIPESWAWMRLESMMALSSGLGYKKSDLAIGSDRMIRVLRGGNISTTDEIIMHDSDVFIAEQFVDTALLLQPGQIITPAVTSLENVGKAALIRDRIPDTVCGGFVFYLTPFLQESWLSEYLYLWLIAPAHRAFCKSSVKKSGQAFYNLSKASLNIALIALPPMEEQKRISQACRKLLTQLTNQ